MADLYSIIPGIQPTAQEILEGELLAKQILEARFPDMDLREGTALRDLLIRPNGVIMAMLRRAVDYYFTQRNIDGVDDATPSEVVDSILSNWFLTRNLGIRSVINARLYFARQKNVSITSDVYFSTDNTLKFYPTESVLFTAESMVFDSYSNEWYIDIDLIAESEGTTYNIGSGSLLYFANFDPYFLHAEVNYLKSESIDSETNLEFIERAKTAISTRNLINDPSIDARLKEEFNYIKRLVTVGMGDPEMVRDQIKAVFDTVAPRQITTLTATGSTATAVLSNHGLITGQNVMITGAVPSGYNGQFVVTVTDANTFTYTANGTPGVQTSVPFMTPINFPIQVHNGGMVDVYCSDKLATSIIQVTLDSSGKAEITGPIYSLTRSLISGGADADTVASGASFTATNAYSLQQTLNGATCSATTVTATVVRHGLSIGRYITISGANVSAYNGVWRITDVPTDDTFTFQVPANIGSNATSGVVTSMVPWYDYGFSQRQKYVVDFGNTNAGKTASFEIDYFQNLGSVQTFLEDAPNRVLCGDLLARGFNFYSLSFTVTSYNTTAPNSAEVSTIISSYLDGLTPGDMFVMSDLLSKLRLNGIVNIKTPIQVTYKLYTRDMVAVQTGTITDLLDPNDRTCIFILENVTTQSQNVSNTDPVII